MRVKNSGGAAGGGAAPEHSEAEGRANTLKFDIFCKRPAHEMTTVAHALSASYLALAAGGVSSTQTPFIVAALISASIPDLDHLYFILKDRSIAKRGRMHKARSMLHELIGFFVVGILTLIIGLFNQQAAIVIGLALMIHLAEDMLVGISLPFAPVDKTEVALLPQNFMFKVLLDAITVIIFGGLWIIYLNAPK
ncbi:metal-dependent hydrolase [Candidatus Gottesmanbacteria bacterium]|nr:metal-dependent hydrolase [Candidatus Gottesmanbacteria bacterium]